MSPFDKDAQFLKSNAAAMRALAGGKEHQVTYAGTDTHVGNDDVRLPALPPTATATQKASLRGAADGAALCSFFILAISVCMPSVCFRT